MTGPDAALRTGLAASMLVGLITSRRIIGVPLLVAAEPDKLVAIIAPAIQESIKKCGALLFSGQHGHQRRELPTNLGFFTDDRLARLPHTF